MQQETRVRNASRNVVFGMFLKGYQILLPFIMRTAIMYYVGDGYLGLNSLFGSVLWVLNLAELGVGSAMVYSMLLLSLWARTARTSTALFLR